MTRVLMVLPDGTLDEGFSGAASRYTQDFMALHRLGMEVHVLRVCDEKQMAAVRAHEARLNGSLARTGHPASWVDVTYPPPERPAGRLHILRQSFTDPVGFHYPAGPAIRYAVQESIARTRPDLLWLAGVEVVAAVGQTGVPTVYTHTDTAYRVQAIRLAGAGWRQRYFLWVHRRAEETITRQAMHIITGSVTGAQRLQALGCAHVVVIPTTYSPRLAPAATAEAESGQLRVVHLGSLETTANRVGLLGYLQQAHPEATAQCAAAGHALTLWIIGDNKRMHPELAAQLNRPANIHQTGFVPDLAGVLRPFDVAILPYEHDTGYRTKLPLLFSFAQVVLSTKAAVAGTQTAGLAEVCVLVDGVADFPAALARLADRPDERERIGRAAHTFFMNHFIHEAVQPQYARFLEQVLEQQP